MAELRTFPRVALVLALAAGTLAAVPARGTAEETPAGAWTAAERLTGEYRYHSATVLDGTACHAATPADHCGDVLLVGETSAELYDPHTDTARPTAAPEGDGEGRAAVLIGGSMCVGSDMPAACGQVLIVGGTLNPPPELYDPTLESWRTIDPPPRMPLISAWGMTLTQLDAPGCMQPGTPSWCGKILLAGGARGQTVRTRDVYLFDPFTESWTPTAPMTVDRVNHSATLLPDGRLLVVGGDGNSSATPVTAEIYDPDTATWTPTLPIPGGGPRRCPGQGPWSTCHPAVLLADGTVLVVGNRGQTEADRRQVHVFDPDANAGAGSWTPVAPLLHDPLGAQATLLHGPACTTAAAPAWCGRVLVAGGWEGERPDDLSALADTELYDPATDTWIPARPLLRPSGGHTATLLDGGRVLVVGGADTGHLAQVFDPTAVVQRPSVIEITPSVGETAGGTLVTISGAGFDESSVVRFGDTTATAIADSGTTITATSPPHQAGPVHVVVTTAAGASATFTQTTFTYYDPAGTWTETAPPLRGHHLSHTATVLDGPACRSASPPGWCGRVLVAGGEGEAEDAAELFDPTADGGRGRWHSADPMIAGRRNHTATRLDGPECRDNAPPAWCGLILVAGGDGATPSGRNTLASAELYDAATGEWTATSPLLTPRQRHTATLLPSGHVLVAGGRQGADTLASAEVYDPATGTWTATGELGDPRAFHTATLLTEAPCNQHSPPSWCGQVLVAGGLGPADLALGSPSPPPLASAELYDPATGSWGRTDPMAMARHGHSATLLADGRVLVAGGSANGTLKTVELFAAPVGDATSAWSSAPSLTVPRYGHVAVALPDERVLLMGGTGSAASPRTAELFEVKAGSTLTRPPVYPRSAPTAALLLDGRALMIGGDSGDVARTAETFTISTKPIAPIVTAVEPPVGTTVRDQVVTITGHGLHPATTVSFGAREADEILFRSQRRVVVRRPAQPQGDVPVTVTTPIGTSQPLSYRYGDGAWDEAASLSSCGSACGPRFRHTATRLDAPSCAASRFPSWCGSVLVVGGEGEPAPAAEQHLLPPSVGDPTAPRLQLRSTQLYQPATDSWRSAGTLVTGRSNHSATLLPTGNVLVVGGLDGDRRPLRSVELYRPDAGWIEVAPLIVPRVGHTATLLPDGRVLVAGGSPIASPAGLPSSEVFDPPTGMWRPVRPMAVRRSNHVATLLADGRVLVTGGLSVTGGTQMVPNRTVTEAEIFDWRTETWSPAAPMAVGRYDHSATLLAGATCVQAAPSVCGHVLVAGGGGGGSGGLASAEMYDPVSDGWHVTGSLSTPRAGHAAAALVDGRVLVLGSGQTSRDSAPVPGPSAATEVYDPATGRWQAVERLEPPRGGMTATLLAGPACGSGRRPAWCGNVLTVGGFRSRTADEPPLPATPAVPNADLFTPAPALLRIEPALGRVSGGSTTLLIGRGMSGVSDVRFGHVPATFEILSDSEIRARVPAHARGRVQVAAVNAGGTSAQLEPDPATLFTFVGAAGRVADLAAIEVAATGVRLRWSAPDDGTGDGLATQFDVRRSRSPITDEASFAASDSVCEGPCGFDEAVTLSLTNAGLRPATEYWFALRPLNRVGEPGPLSNVVRVTTGGPEAVDGLVAEALSGTRVAVSWPAISAGGEDGDEPAGEYVVKRADAPIRSEEGFAAAVAVCDGVCRVEASRVGEGVSVTVAGLQPRTRYHFAVRARDAAGRLGPLSQSVAVTTPVAVPGGVADLAAVEVAAGQVRLDWSAVGEDGDVGAPVGVYEVRQATVPFDAAGFDAAPLLCTCGLEPARVGQGLSVTVTDLAPGSGYWYAVRPVNRWEQPGAVSNVAVITTQGVIALASAAGQPVARVAGASRIQTATTLSREAFPQGAAAAVLARADAFADALTAGPLAVAADGPLLLTFPEELHGDVALELARLGANRVYVVGGPAALSAAVEQALVDAGYSVVRVAGATRVDTAAAVARQVAAAYGAVPGVVVARADDFPDGLAATNLAAATGTPVVLTWPDALPDATAATLGDLLASGAPVWIAGGPAAVSPEVEARLRDAGYAVARVGGADRYATAVALADEAIVHGASTGLAFLASGAGFADALAAGPAAHAVGGVLLLTDPHDLAASTATRDWLAGHAGHVSLGVVTGGPAAVTPSVEQQLADLLR